MEVNRKPLFIPMIEEPKGRESAAHHNYYGNGVLVSVYNILLREIISQEFDVHNKFVRTAASWTRSGH